MAKRLPEGGLVDLADVNPVDPEVAQEILDLHEALPALEREHPEHAPIVERRYFLGFSQPDVADALELSLTIERRRETSALAFLR